MNVITREQAERGAAIAVHRGPVAANDALQCDVDEVVVFFRDGRALGVLGPGRHALEPRTIPFLAGHAAPDGSLPVLVHFVRTTPMRGLRFGATLGNVTDARTGPATPRYFGEAAVRVADALRLVTAVASAPDADPALTFKSYVDYALREAMSALVARAASQGALAPLAADSAGLAAQAVPAARPRLEPVGIELLGLDAVTLALGETGSAEGAQPVYEMFWDCRFCGKKKLLGLTHRHCPNCGGPQNAEERYFPADAEKVLAKDHEYHGADVVCAHCGEANGKNANNCRGCGAPLEGARGISRRQDQVVSSGAEYTGQSAADARAERAAPAQAKPVAKKKRSVVGTILGFGCLTVLVLLVLVVIGLVWKRDSALVVSGHSWKREIAVERFGPVSDSGWCDSMPADARNVRRSREERSTRKVQDGQDCHMRKVDRGNGTFVEQEECTPKYREEPVYDDKCYYTVDRWKKARAVEATGSSVADTPRWPEPGPMRTGTCSGCERIGERTETYVVEFKDEKSGEKQTCDFDPEKWTSFADGSRWKGGIRVLGHSLDCSTLKPN